MKALRLSTSLLCASVAVTASMADDRDATLYTPVSRTAASSTTPPAAPAPAPAPIQQITADPAAHTPGEPEPAKFTTEAHWETAGYNNTEVVYTILINSQDSRIIHCTTELHGFYLENGQKISISDRQNSTIFPGRQGKAGNWLGMDPNSGATYTVTCHPR
jgi:hypothetical protein